MAIEKMALLSIEGNLRKINRTLVKCCESNCFHIVETNKAGVKRSGQGPDHGSGQSFGQGSPRYFSGKNPFGALVDRASALADGLGIEIVKADYDDVPFSVSIDFSNYLKGLEDRYNALALEKGKLEQALRDHSGALLQVERIAGFNVDFEDLYACRYVKVRFGKLPVDSLPKLEYYKDRNFIFYHFYSDSDYVWIFYVAPVNSAEVVDDIFSSLYFERILMPDYLKGNADDAKSAILRLVREESGQLDSINAEIRAMCEEEREEFLKVFNKLKAIDQSYDLRQNVTVIKKKFYFSGYVPRRKLSQFKNEIEEVGEVTARESPLGEGEFSPPVLIRNNWFFRPFEMFVKMYGLPDYNGFDPTPYVGATFMLIFGIMFGDVGQGLLISLLGLVLDKWRHPKLAPVMKRIGLSSAVFGVLYGSVFGSEELIKPFFHFPSVYQMLGMNSPPKNIFQVSTILLVSAIAIGAVLIMISMMMNIVTNLRSRNYADAFIGASGVSGLVFYASLAVGAVLQLLFGIPVFSTAYILVLIVLPLILLFLKEPVVDICGRLLKKQPQHGSTVVAHAVKTYSDAVSDLGFIASQRGLDLEDMLEAPFELHHGSFTMDSFERLASRGQKQNLKFLFYPFESDGVNVSGVYMCPESIGSGVEKLFDDLGFKRDKMPEYIVDLRKESNLYLADPSHREKPHKKSVGSFIIEGIIELFESCLTYITNTMSFLRIGGFILSHAGLMLVVSILAERAGDGVGYVIVQILGNLFVIGMEGFLVGIQTLRLEFYEIFSRFYSGGGKPFKPVTVSFEPQNQ